LSIIVLLLVVYNGLFAQKINEAGTSKYYFCIKLTYGESDNLVIYSIVGINKKGKQTQHFLSRENWMYEFTANRPSLANPNNIDFMKEYNINYKTIKSLWKIKFSEYPWSQKYPDDIVGWAGKQQSPSKRQMEFLKQYGINKFISDPIYGDKLIKLLQDMQNEAWVNEYINLK